MVSVLFAARNSVYKTLPGVDVWDEERDALKWPGGNPGVFHPPCRLFSAFKSWSTAPDTEKDLAQWAIKQVRQWGGVLEHPAKSGLWNESDLPLPGRSDTHGMTIAVYQWWWGHKVHKSTWLYICGTKDIPDIPFKLGKPSYRYDKRNSDKSLKQISSQVRSQTPPEFAKWLIEVASKCT